MYRIIAVDDEPWAISSLLNAYEWEKNGFTIALSTMDPFFALQEIMQQKPDVAFVDIRIGGMDGLNLIRRCRQQGCKTVFLILSAFDDFNYAKTAISLGAFEYLLKPIDKTELSMCMLRVREELDAKQTQLTEDSASTKFPEIESSSDGFEKLLAYLNAHYAEDISLSTLSEKFYYRHTYICDLFRTRLGMTLSEYLNDIRLREAYRLITKQKISTTHAAEEVGYSNYSYFCRLFKSKFGITPTRLSRNETGCAKCLNLPNK